MGTCPFLASLVGDICWVENIVSFEVMTSWKLSLNFIVLMKLAVIFSLSIMHKHS